MRYRSDGDAKDEAAGHEMAALTLLRGYWEALRPEGTGIPSRSAVDPRGLTPVLDRVFLAERIAPGEVRLRIAGITLTDLAGCPMHGVPLSLLFLPGARPALAGACRSLFDAPAAIEITAEALRGIGRPALTARLLLLPLTSSSGGPELALGCVALDARLIGRAPRQFAIAGVKAEPLRLPAGQPAGGQLADDETEAPVLRRYRHLRLVHSA